MVEHPRHIEEVTPEWMTFALRQAVIPQETTVRHIEIETFSGGLLSGAARVVLDYDGDAGGAPESVVVKLPTIDETARYFLPGAFRSQRRHKACHPVNQRPILGLRTTGPRACQP